MEGRMRFTSHATVAPQAAVAPSPAIIAADVPITRASTSWSAPVRMFYSLSCPSCTVSPNRVISMAIGAPFIVNRFPRVPCRMLQ